MKLNPYLAILIAALLGASSGVFIKLLNLPSTSLSFFRFVIPVVALGIYFLYKKQQPFVRQSKLLFLASVLNAFRMFLFFVAYLYTSIANAVIILFTWPIFATIFGSLFLKEKVTKRSWLLIALAFFGIVIMYVNQEISFTSNDFLGMLAMLLSAIVYAVTVIIYKKELKNHTKTQTIFYQNFVGALLFLPFIFINKPAPTLIQFSVGSLYGFLIGIVAFILFFYSLKKLKVSHYSLFTYFEVPFAILFGVLFFKEIITWNMVVGGLLIILSGLLLRKEKES